MDFEKLETLRQFELISREDRLKATIAFEKNLAGMKVVGKYKYSLYSKLPTSLLPKSEENAQMINEILIKSWETQVSFVPSVKGNEPVLVSNACRFLNGFLMYYFKNLKIADNMKRVIGVQRGGQQSIVHSYLMVGDHVIDNTFCEKSIKFTRDNPTLGVMLHLNLETFDVDPANPDYAVNPITSEVGLENERLVHGNDEKIEQVIVWFLAPISVNPIAIFDVHMRKFIKEKYGVEIKSLANKWIKLCWNCFAATEELWMCSKCKTARYCGKNCQAQDWKVHKILHKSGTGTARSTQTRLLEEHGLL